MRVQLFLFPKRKQTSPRDRPVIEAWTLLRPIVRVIVVEIGGYVWENPTMIATVMREKRQVTLPQEVCEAVGLHPGDQVEWDVEQGIIRGRKLVPGPEPRRIVGKLVKRGDALILEAEGIKVEPQA